MSEDKKHNLIVILGPTASGKTALAVRLATEIGGEIISADSRQVYRCMDLGTGKDLNEYNYAGKEIPFHIIDVIDPQEEFNLFLFQKHFVNSFEKITQKEKIPILVGGTGLYLESIILNYRLPEAGADAQMREEMKGLNMEELIQIYLSELKTPPHNSTDMTDRDRLIRAIEISRKSHKDQKEAKNHILQSISPLVIGVCCERTLLRKRISERLQARFDAGMIAEVRKLKEQGLSWERLDAFGLEYRYIAYHLQGQITYAEMFSILETKIHQFAKRQETWFRRMERKGIEIHWIDYGDYAGIREMVRTVLVQ